MKKIILLIILLVCFAFSACRHDTTQLAEDAFSKYYDGGADVVLVLEDTIYFENHKIDLNKLKNEEANNGLIIKKDKLYFSTSKQNSMYDYTLNIYESDLSGANIKLVFSKGNYKTYPWVYGIDDAFYIEYYLTNALDIDSRQIDKFSIQGNEYENVAGGKDCSLSNYTKKSETSIYDIKVVENLSPQEHGKFIITNSETNEIRIIDDAFLKNTVYIESMEMYNYSPKRYDISNGHILLTYSIGAGDGWNFPHLIFEYDFDTDTLVYKMLVFPYDSVPIEIIYIN